MRSFPLLVRWKRFGGIVSRMFAVEWMDSYVDKVEGLVQQVSSCKHKAEIE